MNSSVAPVPKINTALKAYHDAVDTFEAACKSRRRFREAVQSSNGEKRLAEKNVLSELVPPGLYLYWESQELDPKVYVVFESVFDLETFEPQTLLSPLYGSDAGSRKTKNLITGDGFLEPIRHMSGSSFPYTGPKYRLLMGYSIKNLERIRLHAKECSQQKTLKGVRALIDQVVEEEAFDLHR